MTPGYTINLVKDRAQPAVLLLNTAPATNRGDKTFYITVPESGEVFEDETGSDDLVVTSGKRVDGEDNIFYFVEDSTEEVISSEVIVEDGVTCVSEVETSRFVQRDSEYLDSQVPDSVVYYQENPPSSDPSVFFTEVAHEEIVIEEVLVDSVVENRKTSIAKSGSVITCVQCDLCNSKLSSAEEAKNHMRHIHNILTYEGPFFKCEFCGIFVTDRVSHMKVAHYSPLAQAFCKTNSTYQCLQCEYSSDQLTNIRNHVDAKHSNGENKYLCEECNSEYKTLNSMRAHKSRVHVKKRRLIELNQVNAVRDSYQNIHKNQKLQEEILELEQKTFSKFVKRRNLEINL